MSSRAKNRRPVRVTPRALAEGLRYLAESDSDLQSVLREHGAPPLWARPPGFATLVHIILEQQVSLASAQAAFDKLRTAVSPLTPEAFLELDGPKLKEIGFSGQKAGYCRALAAELVSGELDLEALDHLQGDAVRRRLIAIKGIGPWTADIYLLIVLRRRDIWPVGDLALAKAAEVVKGLAETPKRDELEALAEPWRPWRSVAARLLWHHYLETRRNGGS